ncbi:hypothetical protein B0J11DRAFT_518424 [Dendryphion nanum]|uniref:Uncharacterized protein n=1 Tax=Dendryphion nanum TaxID=256645 RepID=A0A9P9EF85_9PLEO|nr:hypothetical protein B0J11DRAFT_518424 [Dendryphion nanum]
MATNLEPDECIPSHPLLFATTSLCFSLHFSYAFLKFLHILHVDICVDAIATSLLGSSFLLLLILHHTWRIQERKEKDKRAA